MQLCNQLVTLANDVLVLLVLVIRAVGLDDALAGDTVDGAGDAASGDEPSKIAIYDDFISSCFNRKKKYEMTINVRLVLQGCNLPVQKVNSDAKVVCHAF